MARRENTVTDDLPEIFDPCTPRPAPAELRARTLSAVDRELARRRKPRWERAFQWAVAASLLVGVGLNVWLWRAGAARPAMHGAPGLATREPAERDSSTAALRGRRPDLLQYDRYQHLLYEFSQGRFPESL
jgi:hypothetical protein